MSNPGAPLGADDPDRTMASSPWPRVSHWWIDQVGGVLAVRAERAVIGHVAGKPDISIAGRLSRRHAELTVGPSGIVLHAVAPTTVNEQTVSSLLLRNGDRLKLGDVEFLVCRPAPWTATSRLEIVSNHRLAGGTTAVVLLGEACILGSGADAHVPLRSDDPVFLLWRGDHYCVRGPAGMSVDGQTAVGPVRTNPRSRIKGPWGTIAWEPATPASG